MHGYLAFYANRKIKIYASSLYDAKQKALAQFRPPKSKQGLVSIVLAEKEGKPVVHRGGELP